MWLRQRRLWWTSGGTEVVDHPPLTIDSLTVERVSSTTFLGMHITEDLTWTTNTTSLSKKAQQSCADLKEQVSLHPSSPHSTGEQLSCVNHLTPLWNLIHNPSSWNQDPPPSHHTTPHAPHENCWKPQEHCAILSVLHAGECAGQTTCRETLFFSLYAPDTFL